MADDFPKVNLPPQPADSADQAHCNAATLAPLISTRLVGSMGHLETQLDTLAQQQFEIHQRLLQLAHDRSVAEDRLAPFVKTLEKVPQYRDKIRQYRQRMTTASDKANDLQRRANQLRLFKIAKDQEREQFISQQQLLDQAIEAQMAPSVQATTHHPSPSTALLANTDEPSRVALPTGSSAPTPHSIASAPTSRLVEPMALPDAPIAQSPQPGQALRIKRLAGKKKSARRPLIE
ncbi:hypothetical protein H4R34_003350 [Dimargaris verticillata]|uniref:Uncharacterized protein n=1 Tax=Dimargaris verticillata TaxID=2761393 RepID=A0A9W8B4R0_9FUNG|nr:hypothetical protein H4R34_003350 [Dimargaris verticillata]